MVTHLSAEWAHSCLAYFFFLFSRNRCFDLIFVFYYIVILKCMQYFIFCKIVAVYYLCFKCKKTNTNAQIGKNVNHKFSLHNLSNRNGEHLTDFMLENRLTCLITKFQKRKGKQWACTFINNTKAQIDYIFRGCVLWLLNYHGKDMIESMKECSLNNNSNNNRTLWLVPS